MENGMRWVLTQHCAARRRLTRRFIRLQRHLSAHGTLRRSCISPKKAPPVKQRLACGVRSFVNERDKMPHQLLFSMSGAAEKLRGEASVQRQVRHLYGHPLATLPYIGRCGSFIHTIQRAGPLYCRRALNHVWRGRLYEKVWSHADFTNHCEYAAGHH